MNISFIFGIIIIVNSSEFFKLVNLKIIIDNEHQMITKILGNSLKILDVLCKFISP